MNEMNEEWTVVDETTTDVLGRLHTKAPLAAALSPFMSLLYPPNPWCEWCDVWRLTTTPRSTSPTLFEQWCGFFYVPQEPDKCKCCETGPTVFCPYPRRLESLTVCRCLCKAALVFLLSYLKTLSVGPPGVRIRDLPLSRPALFQLSWPGGGYLWWWISFFSVHSVTEDIFLLLFMVMWSSCIPQQLSRMLETWKATTAR